MSRAVEVYVEVMSRAIEVYVEVMSCRGYVEVMSRASRLLYVEFMRCVEVSRPGLRLPLASLPITLTLTLTLFLLKRTPVAT